MNINFYIRNITKKSNLDQIMDILDKYDDYPVVFDLKNIDIELIKYIFERKYKNIGIICYNTYIANFLSKIKANTPNIKVAVVNSIYSSDVIKKTFINKMDKFYMNTYIDITDNDTYKEVMDYYNIHNPSIPSIGYIPSNKEVDLNTVINKIEGLANLQRIKLGVIVYPMALNPGNIFFKNPMDVKMIIIEENNKMQLEFINYTARTTQTYEEIKDINNKDKKLNDLVTFKSIDECIENAKLYNDLEKRMVSALFSNIEHKDLESNEKYHRLIQNILQNSRNA